MKEHLKDVIDSVLAKSKCWLEKYEEWKGDKWFRKKWTTPEIVKTYNIDNEEFVKQLAKDMYYAGMDINGQLSRQADFDDLPIVEAAAWLSKAMVLNEKYNITKRS